jgi:hypothetical protein
MATTRNSRSVDTGMLPLSNTQKGVKVAIKAIYAYPDGAGWFTFDNKYEIRFNDEYDAIRQITDVLAEAKRRAKEKAQGKAEKAEAEHGRNADGTFASEEVSG